MKTIRISIRFKTNKYQFLACSVILINIIRIFHVDKILISIKFRSTIDFYDSVSVSSFTPFESNLIGYKNAVQRIENKRLKWEFIIKQDHVYVQSIEEVVFAFCLAIIVFYIFYTM